VGERTRINHAFSADHVLDNCKIQSRRAHPDNSRTQCRPTLGELKHCKICGRVHPDNSRTHCRPTPGKLKHCKIRGRRAHPDNSRTRPCGEVRFPMPLSTKYIPEQAFVEGIEGGGEVDEQKIRNQAPSTSTLQTNTTGGLDEPVTTNVAREASLVVWKGSTCAVGRK
jgi:hypothetical protein